MGTSDLPTHASSYIPHRQQKSQNQRHLSGSHATTSVATAHESHSGQLSMRHRRAPEVETRFPPANSQLYFPEGTMSVGAPGVQPPISEDMGRIMFTSSHSSVQLTSGSPGVPLSMGHSQSPSGVIAAQSSPHPGRVPPAPIATAVAPIASGSAGPEGISTGANGPHFYSSPVAMEAPCAFVGQPQPSTPPMRARRRTSRINTATLERSASLGHWTDGLVRPPPPIPPRNRPSNNPTSTGLRGSQDSRSSEATMRSATRSLSSLIPRRSSSNERIRVVQRMPELPRGSEFDPVLALDPLSEEPTPDELQPITVDMSHSLNPQVQTYSSRNQISNYGNLAVVSDKRPDNRYLTQGEFSMILDDAASVMTSDSKHKSRRWPVFGSR